ncbi:MAG: hypothetical protein QOE70_2630 [Chthoniobacter sp.]|nr:hypothetical protein [Chthoniobacter sp.]
MGNVRFGGRWLMRYGGVEVEDEAGMEVLKAG